MLQVEGGAFSKKDLDDICKELTPASLWWNPHCSSLGTGNYDINVISKALQGKGLEIMWYDKRRDPSCLVLDEIKGFILNTPNDYKVASVKVPVPFQRRHWIALRKIHHNYYNLDSKLPNPKLIGKNDEMYSYLSNLVGQAVNSDDELFVVVKNEVEKSGAWRKSE